MNQIVAGRKRDPDVFTVQKYDNDESWNIPGGTAPSGIHATRYLRRTDPDLEQLTPLARWLVEHIPGCVAGRMPHPRPNARVRAYNGRTQGEHVMHIARTTQVVNCVRYRDPHDAVAAAERLIAMYDGLPDPQRVEDWLFDVIEPQQTDEDYWNIQAVKILAAGVVSVETNGQRWEVQ